MNESPGGMQPPPVWPPSPDALRPSPFPHPALHALHTLARALLFPSYWLLDQLLLYLAPYPQPRPCSRSVLRAIASSIVVLLLLASLPLTLPSLLLWLLLQAWRRPFCYQPPPHCWTPPAPWRPGDEPARCFGFLSANVCLLPNGPACFNNLQHSQQRATAVGTVLLAHLQGSCYGATGCSPQALGTLGGALTSKVPAGLDFVCLQEVFDLRASRRLVRSLAPHLGPVLYDVGTFGLQSGPYLKLLSSGLLLASRYPLLRAAFRAFPDARQEDALASKGLLSAQVRAFPLQQTQAWEGAGWPRSGWLGDLWCCRHSWASWTGVASWASCTAHTWLHKEVSARAGLWGLCSIHPLPQTPQFWRWGGVAGGNSL